MAGKDPFDDPQSDIVKFSAFEGELVLVSPLEQREVATTNGAQQTITANVVLLSGKVEDHEAPFEFRGLTIFGKGLVPTLARSIGGKPVLGVLGKGTPKAGQKPPWVLNEATTEQKKVARAYIESQSPFNDPSES